MKNTDIRFDYDFSDSDNAFLFGGPRIPSLAAAAASSSPLPNVTNTLAAAARPTCSTSSPDEGRRRPRLLVREVRRHRLRDHRPARAQPGVPRIDYLGEINTGYGNRPYDGNTFSIRLLYSF